MYIKDLEPYKYSMNRHNRNNYNRNYKSKLFTKNNSDIPTIKTNKKKIGTKWRRILNDYSQNTTLHGLRYAGNNELSASER